MDINFHYFAVKAAAASAEFNERDAQRIASYSQFVDDYNKYAYMIFSHIPDFAKHLAFKKAGFWIFNPATTGFTDWFDMLHLLTDKNQRNIVIPFHFIPHKKTLNREIDTRVDWRVDWRVVPARLEEPSLITDKLIEARREYRYSDIPRNISLMKIGMLLHTFADTYAHQNYSGFRGWENHSKLLAATNNINSSDVLASYEPQKFYKLISIGHTNVNHAPDDSHISLTYSLKLSEHDDYSIRYERSNTRTYLDAIREILNFLRSCKGLPSLDVRAWDGLSPSFARGFLTPEKDISQLEAHWHSIFGDVSFSYRKDDLFQLTGIPYQNVLRENNLHGNQDVENLIASLENFDGMIYRTKSDDFFRYNVLADEMKKYVNGCNVVDEQWEALRQL